MAEKIRARFKVIAKESGDVTLIAITPDDGDDPERKKFWDATPSGQLHMCVTNREARGFFTLGAEYYLDIVPVDPA